MIPIFKSTVKGFVFSFSITLINIIHIPTKHEGMIPVIDLINNDGMETNRNPLLSNTHHEIPDGDFYHFHLWIGTKTFSTEVRLCDLGSLRTRSLTENNSVPH